MGGMYRVRPGNGQRDSGSSNGRLNPQPCGRSHSVLQQQTGGHRGTDQWWSGGKWLRTSVWYAGTTLHPAPTRDLGQRYLDPTEWYDGSGSRRTGFVWHQDRQSRDGDRNAGVCREGGRPGGGLNRTRARVLGDTQLTYRPVPTGLFI